MLEDSDGAVRDTARNSVISIFTMPDVSQAARYDLKKEMLKAGVRKTTSEAILKGVLGRPSTMSSPGSSVNGDASLAKVTAAESALPSIDQPSSGSTIRPPTGRGERLLKKPKDMTQEDILADIEAQAAAAAPAPPSENANGEIQIVYVASQKDLEQEFRTMAASFDGKETEYNWNSREAAVFRIRGMLKSGAYFDYRLAFVQEVKSIQDGIVKAVGRRKQRLMKLLPY